MQHGNLPGHAQSTFTVTSQVSASSSGRGEAGASSELIQRVPRSVLGASRLGGGGEETHALPLPPAASVYVKRHLGMCGTYKTLSDAGREISRIPEGHGSAADAGHQEVIIASLPPEATLPALPGAGGGGGTLRYSTTKIIGIPAFSECIGAIRQPRRAAVFTRVFLLPGSSTGLCFLFMTTAGGSVQAQLSAQKRRGIVSTLPVRKLRRERGDPTAVRGAGSSRSGSREKRSHHSQAAPLGAARTRS